MVAVNKTDQRVAQIAVLFWGMLSEQIGTGMLERLGLNSGSLDAALGRGVLDSHVEFVREFVRLYGESDTKQQVSGFVRDVIAMAETAVRSIDAKGGPS